MSKSEDEIKKIIENQKERKRQYDEESGYQPETNELDDDNPPESDEEWVMLSKSIELDSFDSSLNSMLSANPQVSN